MGLIKTILVILVVLLAVFLVWGLIGGSQAKDIGVTCDSGGKTLCWTWHTNAVGEIQEGLTTLGNTIKENLEKI